jgi:hypothetical protein
MVHQVNAEPGPERKRHMSELRSENEYRARFSNVSRALDFALDIRKFEIELYWKRATYFWTLIAASFAAYFALQSSTRAHHSLILLVSCVGFLLSLGWYLVNRGSKYWQVNWERHVDLLESDVVGPLYKTSISREEFSLFEFWDGYPYSVTRINQLISLFVVLVWFGLVFVSLPNQVGSIHLLPWAPWLLIVVTMSFSVFLLTAIGGSEGKPRRINFRESQLEPAGPGSARDERASSAKE